MQYMLLIYEDEAPYGPGGDNAAAQEIVARHIQFGRDLGSIRIGGEGLKPSSTATTVRTRGGTKSMHDGPFAEAKEQLGGFYLIDVPDLDAAIAIARKLPLLEDGAVEIRPIVERR